MNYSYSWLSSMFKIKQYMFDKWSFTYHLLYPAIGIVFDKLVFDSYKYILCLNFCFFSIDLYFKKDVYNYYMDDVKQIVTDLSNSITFRNNNFKFKYVYNDKLNIFEITAKCINVAEEHKYNSDIIYKLITEYIKCNQLFAKQKHFKFLKIKVIKSDMLNEV